MGTELSPQQIVDGWSSLLSKTSLVFSSLDTTAFFGFMVGITLSMEHPEYAHPFYRVLLEPFSIERSAKDSVIMQILDGLMDAYKLENGKFVIGERSQ